MYMCVYIPVTQETHIAVGDDIARAICSGKLEVTFLLSLGSSIGKSSLPLRNEGSKARVFGLKGPSKVVGMGCLVATIFVKIKSMSKAVQNLQFSIWVMYFCCLFLVLLDADVFLWSARTMLFCLVH